MRTRKRALRKQRMYVTDEPLRLKDIYDVVDNLQKFITQPAVCNGCGKSFYLYGRSGILLLPQPEINDCSQHSYLDLLTTPRYLN